MSASYADIGSISFFVNDPKEHDISEDEIDSLGEMIAGHYTECLAKSELRNAVRVSRVESRRGCIIITLHLTIALVVASGGSLTVFEILKNYKNYRENLIAIAKDLHKLRIELKKFSKALKVWFYRDDIDPDKDKDKDKHKKEK
ncbi:MAG TPA: hypothetical protein VGT99_08595 [Gammaproteobacteria bacterium]|nr:hypothetical protein [Gammaproteobacteria bacterium]